MYVRVIRYFAILLLSILFVITVAPRKAAPFSVGKPAPELAGESWINTKGLTLKELGNRVVLIEFWTYG
jgi:hypothetical protein